MTTAFPKTASRIIAVFDFDGTLTSRDSLLPFLRWAVGVPRMFMGLFVLSPILFGYAFGLVRNSDAKQAVLKYFFAGRSAEAIQELGATFAEQRLPRLLKPEAVDRLKWHQEQGHQVAVVSASLEAYLVPWAQTMKLDHVVGTQLEVKHRRVTGLMLGSNCYGPEKVNRLRDVLGELSAYSVYAYGDSKGDRELLDMADYAFFRRFPGAEKEQGTGYRSH